MKRLNASLRAQRSNPYYLSSSPFRMDCFVTMFLAMTMIAFPAHAQTPASTGSNAPIEITATQSVEWKRNDKQFVARKDVVIKQGDVTITSDLATADYREGATSSMEIYRLSADGNVTIDNTGNKAYGDKAVYDVDGAVATLTGDNLKMVSPEQTITATEKMEYFPNARQARAVGNAKVVRGKDTLSANIITATFKDKSAANSGSNTQGTSNLDRLEATGNVVIVTPTETLRGQKGVYRADSNTAELTGNVKIERGPNIIEGDRAEVDLTTNISKMFGSESGGGRVRGVFFPSSDKGAATNSPSPAPANPATVTP